MSARGGKSAGRYQLKRVYESPAATDGLRVLVDRLWPRGVSKAGAKIDLWLRDLAPSDALRREFHAKPERWAAFEKAYAKELKREPALSALAALQTKKAKTVTLLYAAKDDAKNNAVALLRAMMGVEQRSPHLHDPFEYALCSLQGRTFGPTSAGARRHQVRHGMSVDRRTFVTGAAAAVGANALAGCASSAVQVAAPAPPDPLFNQPFVDIDEWRDSPVRHRYVHGGFTDTPARFSLYFPPPEQYGGRFFQYISPTPVHEDQAVNGFGASNLIPFAIASGGYAVGSNQGGRGMGGGGQMRDATIGAYRVSAAVANYSRELARQMYGEHRVYGYAFGGSGGAYRTIGGAENTTAWDGTVPYVMGTPIANPLTYLVRTHAQRVLKNKFPQIADALEPGGGDVYAILNEEERAALLEATRMGLPPRAWWFHATMGLGASSWEVLPGVDPGYFQDFWTVPGYLGAAAPQSLMDARVQHLTRVVRVIMSNEAAALGLPAPPSGRERADAATAWENLQRQAGGAPIPVAFQLERAPPVEYVRASIARADGSGGASSSGLRGDYALLAVGGPFSGGRGRGEPIAVGDEVRIDNSNFLAAQTYHRHQIPATPDYYVWDQFKDADGSPMYPQRPNILGGGLALNASGRAPTGRFHGKMIVVENLMDWDAYPWQADWYRNLVRATVGRRAADASFRVYFTDFATHGAVPDETRTIHYDGVLQQALRDVSAWAERGITPPADTAYRIENFGEVVVAPTARARRGIQPVATLHANGGARAEVRVGEPVLFTAWAETPPRAGMIVSAEWSFEGGEYGAMLQVTPARAVTLTKQHTFSQPGTYFPTLRVHSQRDADPNTPHARVPTLGRARVVVT